jgi:hypothetical protein
LFRLTIDASDLCYDEYKGDHLIEEQEEEEMMRGVCVCAVDLRGNRKPTINYIFCTSSELY